MGRCPISQTERLLLRPFDEPIADAAMLPREPVRNALHLPGTLGRRDACR